MIVFEFGFFFGLALGWQFFTQGLGTKNQKNGLEIMIIIPFFHISITIGENK